MNVDKVNIKDCHQNACANFLIEEHTIGDLRDEADFDNVVYHAKKSLMFAKDLILNIDGTNEEKAKFIDDVILDYDKFKVNGQSKEEVCPNCGSKLKPSMYAYINVQCTKCDYKR